MGLGAAVLVWLPFEDSSGLGAILLAAGLCSWAAAYLLREAGTSPRQLILRSAAIGVLGGLLVSPVAFFLMSLKSGLHAHPQPDYSPVEIQAVFSRTAYYAASGFLLGLASALLRIARSEP
jgi:hypothetical protein